MEQTRQTSAGTQAEARLESLDGLRGLAALTVALNHYFALFLPALCGPGAKAPEVRAVPLALLTQANFAVYIFFVLSGFVLSRSVESRKFTLPARLAARYLRLTAPMLASLLFAWGLFHLFPTARWELGRLIPNGWVVQMSFVQMPGLGRVFRDGIYGVYLGGFSRLDGVVWTMRSELLGSILIYLLYRFCPPGRRLAALALLAAIGCWMPALLAFGLGGILREAQREQRLGAGSWSWLALAGGLVLGAGPALHPIRAQRENLLEAAGAALLLLSVLTLPRAGRVLAAATPRFLGRISFAFYLLHLPLLLTFNAWLFFRLPGPFYFRLMAGLVIFLGASATAAWAMTAGLDEPLVRWLHRWKRPSGGAVG
jgi:peptidoglycan/LPS O-acetylase OafA/YrhL